MASNKKCPRCGAEIPEDAPGGACPKCALRDALGLGAYDAKNVDQGADTIPMHIEEKQRSRITQTIAFQRRLRKLLFASRWVVAALFLVIVGYVLVRHAWMGAQIRPNIFLTEDLRLILESRQLDLPQDARLTSVNGTPIESLKDVYRAYDRQNGYPVEYEFAVSTDGETHRRVSYMAAALPLKYKLNPDGGFRPEDTDTSIYDQIDPNERVMAVNGRPLSELIRDGQVVVPITSPNADAFAFERFTLLHRGDDSTRDLLVWPSSEFRHRGRLLGGIGILAIGMLVFWLRPDTRSSAGFLLFAATLGLFYLLRSINASHRLPAEIHAYYIVQCLLPAVTLGFLITFTPLRRLVRHPGPVLGAAAICSILFLLSNSLANESFAAIGLLSTHFFQVWSISLALMLLIALPMDWWLRALRISISPTDKQRSRTLRIALLLGLGPTVLYTAYYSLPGKAAGWLDPLVDVSVLSFPALIGYAVVRHNFLRLNELAREGILYGFLMAVLTGLYAAGTSVVVPFLQAYLPEGGQWPQSFVLAGAMAAIIPVHTATRRVLERRFKRLPFEFEQFVSTVEREGPEWHGPVDYCHMVASQLARMVDTGHITVLTHYPNEEDWSISASTNATDSDTASESCKMLCALLEQERSEVFRDDVLEGFRYRVIQREILDGLEALDAVVVIPLVSRGHVIGAISLGDKSGNFNYSAAELHTLKRIASHVAGTLYNLMTLTSFATGTRICDIWPDWPERIGGYAIERPIGEGGMACVFLGRRDGKPYAIKVANRLVQSNSRLMERFHREASAIQRLNHPHIVQIVEVGWEGPEPFIVFEYLENGSLDQMVNPKDPLDIPSVIKYAIQLAEALQYAHEQGVIHRDLKPRNIFLDDDFNVKIGDFGLAQIADRSTLTQKGEFFGTPDYLAPELLQGEKSSVQSDMYALGVTLFELAAGRRPFVGESAEAIMHQRLHEHPPNLMSVRPDAPECLIEAVRVLLSPAPEDRFQKYESIKRSLCITGLNAAGARNSAVGEHCSGNPREEENDERE